MTIERQQAFTSDRYPAYKLPRFPRTFLCGTPATRYLGYKPVSMDGVYNNSAEPERSDDLSISVVI